MPTKANIMLSIELRASSIESEARLSSSGVNSVHKPFPAPANAEMDQNRA